MVNMPLTLYDKLWNAHLVHEESDGTALIYVDRHRNYIGYGAEASELVGIPDPETFVQLP